jgi:acyl-CoA thioester hydrolase
MSRTGIIVRYAETVIVSCSVEKLSIARLELVYEVRARHGDRLLASGRTIHAWTDADLKIINLKKTAPDLFEFLKKVE